MSEEARIGLEKNVKIPYIEIKLLNTRIPYENKPSIDLPYVIINIGNEIAKNVQKGYSSFIVDKLDGESLIQSYIDPPEKKVNLVPLETSSIQLGSVDNINISKFIPQQLESKFIRVELKVTYQLINPNEIKTYYTKLILELIPEKTPEGTIVFNVSQKLSDHGKEDNNS